MSYAVQMQQRLREAYADGFRDAIKETLAQIDGTSEHREGIYPGPVPPELTLWIEGIRARFPSEEELHRRAREA